jgi:hypothetical protein
MATDQRNPMRLSPASRLTDRQTVWVGYRNDGSNFTAISTPVGYPAPLIAAQWAETFASDVAPCPISGWRGWNSLLGA